MENSAGVPSLADLATNFAACSPGLCLHQARDLQVLSCNEAYRHLQDEPFWDADLTGLRLDDYALSATEDGLLELYRQAAAGATVSRRGFALKGPARGELFWNITLCPLRGDEGEVKWILSIIADATEHVLSERKTARLIATLNESSERASDNLLVIQQEVRDIRETRDSLQAEVEARKQAEEALRASEGKLRAIVDESRDGISLTDEDGSIVEWNTAQARITGMERGEVLGRPLWDVMWLNVPEVRRTPERQESLKSGIQGALMTGKAPWLDKLHDAAMQRRDGSVRTIQDSAVAIQTSKGFMLCSVMRDVTERTQMEGALQESHELLQKVFGSLNEAVLVMESARRIIYDCNKTAEEMFGYTRDELIGRDTSIIHVNQDTCREFGELASRAYEQTGSLTMEFWMRRKNGEVFPTEHVVTPIRDAEGRVLNVVSVMRDITERKRREDEVESLLHANEELVLASVEAKKAAESRAAELDAVIENMASGLAITDAAGTIMRTNSMGSSLLGLPTSSQATGNLDEMSSFRPRRPDGTNLPPEDYPTRRAVAGEVFVDQEVVVTESSGAVRCLLFSGAPLRDHSGRIIHGVVIYRDVTRLRQLERDREEFIYMISHDLRSPLTAVSGYAQMLQRKLASLGDRSLQRYAEQVISGSRKLEAMIDDMSQAVRLETGKLELQLTRVDLPRLVSEAVAGLGTFADRARVRIEIMNEPIPAVTADSNRLERALINLLTNAVKYSPSDAAIVVTVGAGEEDATVSVIDRGKGIPADSLPLVFEKLYRVKTGAMAEGLGMGLYITRLIMEAHGGRVSVDSEVGKGSTFHLHLPLYASTA